MPQPGEWVWSGEHRQAGRVVEANELWGDAHCRVWLPAAEALVRVPAERLEPAARAGVPGKAWLAYVAAAGRVAEALTQDTLLAPIESSVIPLPHQIQALARATGGNLVRYLLADEVGLGKTVEAGLIMRELKLRGVVRRTLVVAPKGLVNQWIAEMRTHFAEEFRAFIPSDFPAFRRLARADNVWRTCDQVVCPLDAVKPLDGRRGWSLERVAEHNRERFEDLTAASWDLIIIDEAHRLGGSSDQVARHQLGRGLADAAPCLLLLSATPHQGKTDAFHRLMSLIDETAFPDPSEISGERVQPFVIRTEKRHAIDSEGQPLFKPRHTRLEPIAYQERHAGQRALYEAVTEYAREGYNRAIRERKGHVGFLMILMQRLVTSSTRAIRVTLERRLEVLTAPGEQLMLFPELTDEEWVELDGQEQIDTLLTSRLSALKNERAEVELLLETARRTETAGVDAKADALLDWIYRLQQDEGDPDLKILIFTEFVSTQEMLREVSGRPRLLGRLPQRIDGTGRARERAAFVRRLDPLSGVDRRRRRGVEPAVLPRGDQLRHSLESDEARTADRPRRPHRPGTRGPRGQLRGAGHGGAPRARSAGGEAGGHPRRVRRRQDRRHPRFGGGRADVRCSLRRCLRAAGEPARPGRLRGARGCSARSGRPEQRRGSRAHGGT